ncbi:DUF3679 domain-containing protein [Bacillus sp. MRMR6]|uniref:DUF3679 domain-containing protein n=1 Tax=Bacillus sp. MRMR6 TaxID=1928617 RepID=UPI000952B82C|nr:DUF3679 domain-containing protein [Bacillus sp. MRMR6]OLS41630.1 hypothetical protein BTR25_03520 [Bacillus sp. MRMR6]
MKMFMMKAICIAALMFISVLAGMQLANDGIHKMKGYDDPNFQRAVALNDNGEQITATFLGNDLSSHDLDEKKKKLEEMNAYNVFSSLGKNISEGVSSLSGHLIKLITE